MLEVISCQREGASDEDIVAVLASYLKRNPNIAALTVDAANLRDTSVTGMLINDFALRKMNAYFTYIKGAT